MRRVPRLGHDFSGRKLLHRLSHESVVTVQLHDRRARVSLS